MNNEKLFPALVQLSIVSIIIIVAVTSVVDERDYIGPVVFLLGFLPWAPLRLAKRDIHSVGADIIFGAVDTGLMAAGALIGASFAGVLGAVVGSTVGDSITDGFAGLFEGKVSEYLRDHGIDEARTPLSSSLGKMSGCLIGGGITLTAAWTILGL